MQKRQRIRGAIKLVARDREFVHPSRSHATPKASPRR
jgi:hypothetical protein